MFCMQRSMFTWRKALEHSLLRHKHLSRGRQELTVRGLFAVSGIYLGQSLQSASWPSFSCPRPWAIVYLTECSVPVPSSGNRGLGCCTNKPPGASIPDFWRENARRELEIRKRKLLQSQALGVLPRLLLVLGCVSEVVREVSGALVQLLTVKLKYL